MHCAVLSFLDSLHHALQRRQNLVLLAQPQLQQQFLCEFAVGQQLHCRINAVVVFTGEYADKPATYSAVSFRVLQLPHN